MKTLLSAFIGQKDVGVTGRAKDLVEPLAKQRFTKYKHY